MGLIYLFRFIPPTKIFNIAPLFPMELLLLLLLLIYIYKYIYIYTKVYKVERFLKNMINKMISVPLGIFEKLKKEENASALICRLLSNYYETKFPEDDYDEKLKELQKKKEEFLKEFEEKKREIYVTIKEFEEKERDICYKKEIKQKQIERVEKKQEENKEKKEEKIETIKNSFLDLMGREMTSNELTDYISQLSFKKGYNLFLFIEDLKNASN